LANAQKEAKRQAELLAKGMAAEDVVDQAKTAVEVLAAAVRAETAAVESAALNREYCTIASPLDGHVGARLLDPGNLVTAGGTALAVINQIRPVQVSFTMPQQSLPEIRRRQAAGKLSVRATASGQADAAEGQLTFIDNAVDRATGTIRLKAAFANADQRLWPGQFVTAVLTLAVQPNALVVPAQAVQTGQQGQFVFVITPELTAESRPVTVDRTLGGEAIITGQVQPGEQVVTDGQLMLTKDAKVTIKGRPGTNAPAGDAGEPAKERPAGPAPRDRKAPRP
jgi:multidrug efflux system membrane fusion protein